MHNQNIQQIMKRIRLYILPLLAILTGCSIDERSESAPVNPSFNGNMTFTVELPDPATGAASYALNEADENKISSVDVFAFSKDETDKFVFVDHTTSYTIETDGTNSRKKTFRVSFQELQEVEKYCFVVLANVAELTKDKTFTQGTEMYALLKTFELTNISKWKSADKNIPMWGKTEEETLITNMTIDGLKLLRMVAKINVAVDEEAQDDFKLSSVRLYNYRKGGYVVPDTLNLANNYPENGYVIKPTVLGDKVTGESSPILYHNDADNDDLTPTDCTNQIYTFETNVENPDKTHTLVIGGSYKNGEESFYRIDFISKDKENKTVYLDLLRNHRYTVTITNVKGKGYTTHEEAFRSKGINMEADVVEYDDGEMSEVVFDGQYTLTVSKGVWSFLGEAQTTGSTGNTIKIATDHPNGWNAGSAVNENGNAIDWLSLNKGTIVAQLILKENDTDADRTGYITVTAGRLSYKITVTQLKSKAVAVSSVELTSPTTCIISKNEEQELIATVTPAGATNQNVVWSTSNSDIVTVTQNGVIKGINPGEATITVMTIDGNKTATCVVTVSGLAINKSELTLYAGEKETLTATLFGGGSGVTWSSSDTNVAMVNNYSGEVTAVAVGTATITATDGSATVTCEVTIPDNYMPTAHGGWAGSNIYWDGSKLTFDDTDELTDRQHQGVFFKWGSLWGISPEGNWEDDTTPIYSPDGSSSHTSSTSTWDDIPSVTSAVDNSDRAYLHEITDWSAGTGDICKFLTSQSGGNLHGKKWRMPTANELELLGLSKGSGDWTQTASVNTDGTSTINSYYSTGSIYFPASGSRTNDGTLGNAGAEGHYWSSSPSNTNGYSLAFSENAINNDNTSERTKAYSIRCVIEK